MPKLTFVVGVLWLAACGDKTPAKVASTGSADGSSVASSSDGAAGVLDAGTHDAADVSASVPIGSVEAPKGLLALRTALGIDGSAAPKTIDASAKARLALRVTGFDDKTSKAINDLRIYKVAAGKLEVESSHPLAEDALITAHAWRNANELVVLLSDGKLLTVRDGKATPLARPPAKFFAAKKSGDGKANRDEALIATATDEVWLQHCAYAIYGDEDPCTSTVYVRLLPTPASATKAPAPRVLAPQPLAGWTLTVKPSRGNPYGVVDCKGPGGAAGTLTPKPDDQMFGYSVHADGWVSSQPPIALVEQWTAGMDEATPESKFLAGCSLAPDLDAGGVARGPSGFWAIGGLENDVTSTATAVLWHGRTIGVVIGGDYVQFAP